MHVKRHGPSQPGPDRSAPGRLLHVTVRMTSARRAAEYESAWVRLRETVLSAGGRAWRFHDPDASDRRLEFVEWKQAADGTGLLQRDDVRAALEDLDRIAPAGRSEIWEESP